MIREQMPTTTLDRREKKQEARGAASAALALVLSLSFALAACVKPSRHSGAREADALNAEESASFYIDFVTGSIQDENDGMIADWKIPTKRKFTFSTCAHDRRSGEPLKGVRFDVRTWDGSVQSHNASDKGCFDWTETIPVNYLADAHGVRLTRDIQAVGTHTGFRRAPLVVFPWWCPSCAPAARVVDLRCGAMSSDECEKVPKAQIVDENDAAKAFAGIDDMGVRVQRPVWIDPAIFIRGSVVAGLKNGGVVRLALGPVPTVMVRNLLGAEDKVPFVAGKFRAAIDAYAIVPDVKGGTIGVLSSELTKVHIGHGEWANPEPMAAGQLSNEIVMQVSNAAVKGSIEIAITLIPDGGPPGLTPYHGVFLAAAGTSFFSGIVPGQAIKTSGGGPMQALAYQSYVDESYESWDLCDIMPNYARCQTERARGAKAKILKDVDGLPRMKPFQLKALTATVFGVDNRQSIVHRTVHYDVAACIQFMAEAREARNIVFNVTSPEGRRMQCAQTDDAGVLKLAANGGVMLGECRTDLRGCLRIPDQVPVLLKMPQRPIYRPFSIATGEYRETAGYFANPWDQTAPGVWERDRADIRKAQTEPLNSEPTKFVASSFTWRITPNGFSYLVDKYLNLTLSKWVRLSLPDIGIIQNNTMTSGVGPAKPLEHGWYLIRVGVQKQFFNWEFYETGLGKPPSNVGEFVALDSRAVWYDGRGFNTNFEFKIPDLRMLRLRANLLVEIALLDDTKLERHIMMPTKESDPTSFPINAEAFERLAAHGVGLEPRTFVGPTILSGEIDSGPLQPTDSLGDVKCSHQDCDVTQGLKTRPVAESTFPNSGMMPESEMKRLQGASITDLIHKGARVAQSHHEGDEFASKFSNMLPVLNLDFVPLDDRQRFYQQDPRLASINVILPNPSSTSDPAQALIARLNDPKVPLKPTLFPPQTISDLQRVIETGDLNRSLAIRLCVSTVRSALVGLGLGDYQLRPATLECVNEMQRAGGPVHIWTIDKKVVMHAVDEKADKDRLQGFIQSFTLSADIGGSHSLGEDDHVGLSGSASLQASDLFGIAKIFYGNMLGGVMSLAGATGTNGGNTSLIGTVAGAVGVQASWTHGFGWAETTTNRYGFNSAHYLAAEITPLEIRARKYERCVAVKLTTEAADALFGPYVRYIKGDHPKDDLINFAYRGLMICDGQLRGELSAAEQAREAAKRAAREQRQIAFTTPAPGPLTFVENYFFIQQEIQSELVNDRASMDNNPWLRAIRGESTYAAFIGQMRATSVCAGVQNANVDNAHGTIDQIADAYRRSGSVPSTKGIFSEGSPYVKKVDWTVSRGDCPSAIPLFGGRIGSSLGYAWQRVSN